MQANEFLEVLIENRACAALLTVRVVYIDEGTMEIEPVVAVTAAAGEVVALAQSGAAAALAPGGPPAAAPTADTGMYD